MRAIGLTAHFGSTRALHEINLPLVANQVTAIIGPSGCGKSTFIRCLNRMHEVTPGARATGRILLDTEDILAKDSDPVRVRRRVGMVFQKPNPFPKSIYENVAYSLRVRGMRNKTELDDRVESALKGADCGKGRG